MINTPFTAEEKADLQFLDISELLDVNLVKNFIRLFPPQDVHDVLVNSLYLGIKFIDSKYPKKWLTKSRIENIAGLVHRNKPKNITEIGEESHIPKSKNGIYVKPNGWKNNNKTAVIPYRQYGIPPANIDENYNTNNRYSENDKEIYPQWWPDYNEATEAERSAAIERDKSKHKHHHHITDTSNQKSISIQTTEKESIAVQANPTDIQSLYSNYNNRRSTSVPPNLSKSLRYNKQQPQTSKPKQPQQQHPYNNDYYDYDYNRDYYYRNQPPPPPALPPPPPSNISPYYSSPPAPPPPPPSYYYPLQPQHSPPPPPSYDYYYPQSTPSSSVNPYNEYPYYDPPPPPNYHSPYDYNNNKHVTIDEPIDMVVNHPKPSSKLMKRCATPYPYPRRKYDDNGDEIDIALINFYFY